MNKRYSKIKIYSLLTVILSLFIPALSAQEQELQIVRQIRTGFLVLDTNKDQKLSSEEILKPIQSPPENIVKRVDEFIKTADKNKDQGLSTEELDAVITELQSRLKANDSSPTLANVKYGSHERNTMDIWLAKSDKPTPMVIYIHGGGFMMGDKKNGHNKKNIALLRSQGISYASINYRFLYHSKTGVLGCMEDAKRAIQFLRFNASKWNLDKTRFACIGASAGAGTSLWLAFNDEMADKNNSDPVLQESTRIQAVAVHATQATYNIARWVDLLDIAKEEEDISGVLNFYGFKSKEELDTEQGKKYISSIDFLAHISSDDPPMYASNNMRGGSIKVSDKNHLYHHPLHVKALRDKAQEAGIKHQCYAQALGIKAEGKNSSLINFVIDNLK